LWRRRGVYDSSRRSHAAANGRAAVLKGVLRRFFLFLPARCRGRSAHPRAFFHLSASHRKEKGLRPALGTVTGDGGPALVDADADMVRGEIPGLHHETFSSIRCIDQGRRRLHHLMHTRVCRQLRHLHPAQPAAALPPPASRVAYSSPVSIPRAATWARRQQLEWREHFNTLDLL
jgi:hypothetical protein